MPNQIRQDVPFLGPFANAKSVAQPINNNLSIHDPYSPGDVRQSFENNNTTFTIVIVDSGATAATPVGSVAANQLLFWKDKQAGIVTNDFRFCELPGQPALAAAGVSPVALPTTGTYGTLIYMIVRAFNTAVMAAPATSEGDALGVDTTTSTARLKTFVSTAPPFLGVARSGATAGVIMADFDFGTLP